jgi:hypothetical protein
MSNRNSKSFPSVFLESVDEAFNVLGNEPSVAVYQFLATICALPKMEIPDRISDFDKGLKQALGGASKVIERLILRKLFEKLGFTLKESEALEFVDYVDDAKRRFEIFSQKTSHLNDQFENVRSKKGQVSS